MVKVVRVLSHFSAVPADFSKTTLESSTTTSSSHRCSFLEDCNGYRQTTGQEQCRPWIYPCPLWLRNQVSRGLPTSIKTPKIISSLVQFFSRVGIPDEIITDQDDTGRDWDKWLLFVLFAYREVPQAATDFLPFELLYGFPVQGPLDLLKKSWESKPPAPQGALLMCCRCETD